jgi:hypothetical protein
MPAKAWIVAIEQYSVGGEAAGEPPDLPGIAEWAVQLAEFLVKTARVKPRDVVMNLSAMAPSDYCARLEDLGVEPAGATLPEIIASVKKLKTANTKASLIVYWGGHGTGTPGERYLLTADSSGEDLQGLALKNLLTHLRSTGFPLTQMGFIDACAEPFPAPNAYAFGEGKPGVARQFYFFSASTNEVASGRLEGSGFSSEVVVQLQALGKIPPDPRKFFARLETAFAALVRQKALDSQPFDFEYTNGSGDIWSRPEYQGPSFLTAEAQASGLTTAQFEFLFREMQDCPWLRTRPNEVAVELGIGGYGASPEEQAAALLAGVVRLDLMRQMLEKSRQHDAPGHRGIVNLQQAWNRLQLQREFFEASRKLRLSFQEWGAALQQLAAKGLVDPPAKSPANLEELQLALLNQSNDRRSHIAFIRLLESAGRMAGEKNYHSYAGLVDQLKAHPDLGPLYTEALQDLPDPNEPLYLAIGVDVDPNTGKAKVLKARTRTMDGNALGWLKVPDGTVAQQIFELIDRVKREQRRTLIVELILPGSLLCFKREFLKASYQSGRSFWIEKENAIVVRWQERLASLLKPHPQYKVGDWLLAAKNVRPHVNGPGMLICRWTGPGAALPALGKDCHVIGLNFPGPNEDDPALNQEAFYDALTAGAPYMCWPRRKPEESLETLTAGLFDAGLRDLPDLLTKKKGSGALADLILLMDDPENDPYSDKLKPMRTNPRRHS